MRVVQRDNKTAVQMAAQCFRASEVAKLLLGQGKDFVSNSYRFGAAWKVELCLSSRDREGTVDRTKSLPVVATVIVLDVTAECTLTFSPPWDS